MHELSEQNERAIVISVVRKGSDRVLALEYLDELAFLAETAGAVIIEKFYQELVKPHPATALGKGKLEEIKTFVADNNISLAIFDDDLSPIQVRNIEQELRIKVLDRSGLILDIFASRAKSQEAKTQVELAQMQYLLPRLTRMWTHLSKQFGGIGTRGPGETQIEVDRRMIRTKIQHLKSKLTEIATQREQQRKSRAEMPKFALVGYTNAGKSTLMNQLTEADVYVENKLFATLDTTVRSFELPSKQKAILSDTVGFIRKLPTHLVASFRSTLAEAAEADILVHVVDISHEFFREQIQVVEETLDSLKIIEKPTILVFNKIDMLEDYDGLKGLQSNYPNAVFISAKRGINIQALLEILESKYNEHSNVYKILVPYTSSEIVSKLYKSYEVMTREDIDEGTMLELKIQKDKLEYFNNYFGKYVIN